MRAVRGGRGRPLGLLVLLVALVVLLLPEPRPLRALRLAERLYRLGYNALRVHHYERELVQGQAQSTTLNPEKVDQLDYLLAALIHRGIYLTTDLYVSRPVPWREAGFDRDGQIPMDTFKILVAVHEGAYENWKKFARSFLSHVNPYTQRSYADEPALGWIALINEGNFGNFFMVLGLAADVAGGG
jgi:hypothetical protein